MTSPFGKPASTSGIQFADLKGRLLLIEPLGIETDIPTQYGSADAVRANLHVLDGEDAGESYMDTLIFPRVLRSQLKSASTKYVLGRLGQGERKPGQSPPWKLTEATPGDEKVAVKFLEKDVTPAPADDTDIPF